MEECLFQELFLPSIRWKINKFSGCCSIKGPEISFLGTLWKLTFIYSKSEGGNTSYIILKRSGDCVNDVDIKITTSLVYYNKSSFLPSTVEINVSSSKDWVIWEKKDSDFYKDFGNNADILYYYRCCHFKLDFILGALWTKTNPMGETKQKNVKTAEYSPCIMSLSHEFGNLFNNHLMSDVILECDGQNILAHKNILAIRSPVFAAMFRNDMKESKEQFVSIKDVEPFVLKQMVRYIYSADILDLTPENVYKLYVAADKYGVEALKMKCGLFMVENGKETNPAPEKGSVAKSDKGSMKKELLSHFANIKSIFDSDEWKKLSEKEPKFALKAMKFFVSESP